MKKLKRKKRRDDLDVYVKVVIHSLYRALAAYPLGSKKHAAVINALYALSRAFAVGTDTSIVPQSILALAARARRRR